MPYEPTFESVRQHQVPDWFHDAKLGIMITWGLYSVPGWAETAGDLNEIVEREGWPAQFRKNPYAEWYLNTMNVPGSAAQAFHRQTYGADFSYDGFVPMFNEAIKAWQPQQWASLFSEALAKYVVLVTKHCDTFLPWPSKIGTTRKPNPYHASRDIVGELTEAVRGAGIKMGLYYCGGMDWVYNPKVLLDFPDVFSTTPQGDEFVQRCTAHWHELIDLYKPSIMWGDIGYPVNADVPELFAYYYNNVADGVINDRFAQVLRQDEPVEEGMIVSPKPQHFDFRTPEYTSYSDILDYKWECVRGIGHSFGYNQNEGPDDYISVDKLVHMFVDIVSKNGNLLLGVGPTADGTIPALQVDRLLGLGKWLGVNGEAIFSTRPYTRAEGETTEGDAVRFTRKGETVNAILLGTPAPHDGQVTLVGLRAAPGTTVRLLGHDSALAWEQVGDDLRVRLPDGLPASPAHAVAITPAPTSA
jgi:alpha-L-fucosidase